MYNYTGDTISLKFDSQNLFELSKELMETEGKIRYLEETKKEARDSQENARLLSIDEWLIMLRERAIRLQGEIAALETGRS